MLKNIHAGVLNVTYRESGDLAGIPVFLLHGFPYDVHAYDDVHPRLTPAGCRVIIPYLRGYGPTHFLSSASMRSGQQAALAQDLLSLMDALSIEKAILAGFDWGGRAACCVAALWPNRVLGLVSAGGYGYNIQDISGAAKPSSPENEYRHWYQYYFQSERGRAGLDQYRHAFCKLLWKQWSPHWTFDDATYEKSAAAFKNQDFVDIVIHSYRHRYGLVLGDPAVEEIEDRLAYLPPITVPTVVLHGEANGVLPLNAAKPQGRFKADFKRHVLERVGHNVPQEAPDEFAAAVLSLVSHAAI